MLFFLLSFEHLHAFTVKIRGAILILLLIHQFVSLQHKPVLPGPDSNHILFYLRYKFCLLLRTSFEYITVNFFSMDSFSDQGIKHHGYPDCMEILLRFIRPRSVGSTVLVLRAISNLSCSNWVLRNGLLENIRKGHPG